MPTLTRRRVRRSTVQDDCLEDCSFSFCLCVITFCILAIPLGFYYSAAHAVVRNRPRTHYDQQLTAVQQLTAALQLGAAPENDAEASRKRPPGATEVGAQAPPRAHSPHPSAPSSASSTSSASTPASTTARGW